MIEFSNVSHSYREGRPSLAGFDAVFREGIMTAIFGDNGAGKSTVAMLANGLLKPDAGVVSVDGLDTVDAESLWEIRKKVGLVFQNPDSQFVATTVEREVAFGLENIGVESPEIRGRVDEVLRLLDISELKDRSPRDLSQGEKGIVSVASILVLCPEYLILDEPTSHLDRHEVERLWSLIQTSEPKPSIILITQEREEIERCDHVVALECGRKTYDGPAAEFLNASYIRSGLTELAHELVTLGIEVIPRPAGIDELVDSVWKRRRCTAKKRDEEILFAKSPANEKPWIDTVHLVDGEYVYKKGLPGEKIGVEHANVDLRRGEFLGIVGPNGSGKTTLSLMLAGLFRPTSGSLLVNGFEVPRGGDVRKLRREIGFVFQNPEGAFFTDSCLNEVIFGLKNFDIEKPEEKAASALGFVGLPYEDFGKRSPFEISYGEQRRLAMACALAYEPQILFFDEPTAGLDQKGRDFVYDLLFRIKASGRTVVLISHDLGPVLDLSDRLVALEKGRNVYTGPPVYLGKTSLGEQLGLRESDVHEVLIQLKSKGLDVLTEIFSPRLAAVAINQALA
ncbi:ATP-binding cassette domain-containing protein [candidate division TA06 bacterium]|uniref:ATP-binding cassette domain-containing protein n=1 Tax=candidate division TA06 bacterium TaxID=2250710 RepID=A0A523UWT3_UNCT6|nr:MAG: ATP-binding cassette domain-containing protein [candidate division TA06 bacterium]